MNTFNNLVDFPLTKEQIKSKDFMNNIYEKIKAFVYEKTVEHFTNDITNKFLQNIIVMKNSGYNMKKDEKFVYYFKENSPRGGGVPGELSNVMYNSYNIQNIHVGVNNYQAIGNNEDVKKVTKKIVEKLKERFPDCLIESDMLSTYIVIDWN